MPVAYAIISVGKNDESAHKWHAKSPGVVTSGAFLFRFDKVA